MATIKVKTLEALSLKDDKRRLTDGESLYGVVKATGKGVPAGTLQPSEDDIFPIPPRDLERAERLGTAIHTALAKLRK